MRQVRRAVGAAQRRLAAIYRLDLDFRAEEFVIPAHRARRLLPPASPRTGVLVRWSGSELELALYVDPRDRHDVASIVEETSNLVCLAWHAAQERPVSRLVLELQSEVDRWAVARLAGRDAYAHFEGFVWDDWMGPRDRQRYRLAHRTAHRYCRALDRRYPRRADTPHLLRELRRFYRRTPEEKLRAA